MELDQPDLTVERSAEGPSTQEPSAAELVLNNRQFASKFVPGSLPTEPSRDLVVVACMDVRLHPYELLGIKAGEAHILRNAGGVITDDIIRSIALSQRSLGTTEIVLIHHTDCGLQSVDGPAFLRDLEADTGLRPAWELEDFNDPFVDIEESISQLQRSPFVLHKDQIRGFVYDVSDGLLYESFGQS